MTQGFTRLRVGLWWFGGLESRLLRCLELRVLGQGSTLFESSGFRTWVFQFWFRMRFRIGPGGVTHLQKSEPSRIQKDWKSQLFHQLDGDWRAEAAEARRVPILSADRLAASIDQNLRHSLLNRSLRRLWRHAAFQRNLPRQCLRKLPTSKAHVTSRQFGPLLLAKRNPRRPRASPRPCVNVLLVTLPAPRCHGEEIVNVFIVVFFGGVIELGWSSAFCSSLVCWDVPHAFF